MIKIWVDDERPMPEGYDWHTHSVLDCCYLLGCLEERSQWERANATMEGKHIPRETVLLDLDHDASGEYSRFGGDYINILKWIAEREYELDLEIKVHFHSANPVGVKNMRAIVENCPWMEEVK